MRVRNYTLWFVIGLPIASIVMGMVTLYFAFSSDEATLSLQQQPLTKTSWQEDQ